jgi:hypothetical protein
MVALFMVIMREQCFVRGFEGLLHVFGCGKVSDRDVVNSFFPQTV